MKLQPIKYYGFIFALTFCVVLYWSSEPQPTGANNTGKKLSRPDIHENIYGSAVISASVYILVGSRGKIFRSVDKGQSWQMIASGTRKTLYAVSFTDLKTGWISGQSGLILHTTDGGQTWAKQDSGTKKHLFGISFGDAQHGCAVGDWSIIVVTDDGGATWKDASLKEDVLLYDVHMTDAQNGNAVGEFGVIYSTSDGGINWTRIESPNPEEKSLFCMHRNGKSLYAGGLDGLILYSKDSGSTWSRAANPVNKSIYGISVLGPSGWAVGDSGTVLRTENGGESWQAVAVPEAYKLFWLKAIEVHNSLPEDRYGFVAGANGLYLTIQDQKLMVGKAAR